MNPLGVTLSVAAGTAVAGTVAGAVALMLGGTFVKEKLSFGKTLPAAIMGSLLATASRSSVRRRGDAVSDSANRLGGRYTVFTALPKVYRRSRKSVFATVAPRNRYGL